MDMHDKAPLIDLTEAVHEGWLELWYQPKIDARAIVMRGVEGLLRVRHPSWGILSPSYFIANDGDPRARSVSETVIKCAIDDWYRFFGERGSVEIAVNLPIAFLQDAAAVGYLNQYLPLQAAFERLVVEINGTDIVRNLALAKDVAKSLGSCRVAISIDDVGVEWTSLSSLRDFPFVELKVDQNFIKGCAHDSVKQSMCRRILDLADDTGARTVAEGVETWADFLTVRALGFDLVQGFLFAEPAAAEQFARSCWASRDTALSSDRSTPTPYEAKGV
jgi:EAL domain-containing protein (putative c-di-GMP-specific phosphodiesterase class I)